MLFVFMSQPDFACNPHELWKYVKNHTDYDTAWIVKRRGHYEKLCSRGIACAVYDTLQANELLKKADYIIANSYTFSNIPKNPESVLVNLWHGSGVKAHDLYDHEVNPRHVEKLKKYFELVDLMCVHSLDDRFKLSAMLKYDLRKIYVTGQPRLDLVKKPGGKNKLNSLFDGKLNKYDKIIFFAPSFRANMSCHAGKVFSDNIFRLDDYDNDRLERFLADKNIALVYKLHPIEQTAFIGRSFELGGHCYELNDEMLFDADIRYDEILSAFDIMISDYSSIAYDFLLLDRPIIYLIPDYDEYRNSKGFVFNKVDAFMPGRKAYSFEDLLDSMREALDFPETYSAERNRVLDFRFDYTDDKAAERCYGQIMNLKKIDDTYIPYISDPRTIMPTITEQLSRYIHDSKILLIDSMKPIDEKNISKKIEVAEKVYYITSEIPNEIRSLSAKNSYKINDLEFYYKVKDNPQISIVYLTGGVDYDKFSVPQSNRLFERRRIGFAGTIDNRIYFAMVQCICEAYPEYDIVFAGTIIGDFPVWLNGYPNLKYIECSYDELPEMIASFDVTILPLFGGHNKLVPCELFQYLASGKPVVTSNLVNVPECSAIYMSASISDAIDNIHKALEVCKNENVISEAREFAQKNDWKILSQHLLNNELNYEFEN